MVQSSVKQCCRFPLKYHNILLYMFLLFLIIRCKASNASSHWATILSTKRSQVRWALWLFLTIILHIWHHRECLSTYHLSVSHCLFVSAATNHRQFLPSMLGAHRQTPSTHQGVISLCLHCQGVIWLSVRVWHRQRYTVKDSLSTLQTSRFCIQCIYHVSLHWQYVMPYNHTIRSERQDPSIC